MSRALTAAVMLAAAIAAGCRETPRGPTNVVVVAIDTLRADHLGCYGYSRPTTPRIDALAGEGVVFEHAISQSPWTLPAFASILTGVIPQRHGAGQGKQCLLRPCGALAPDQATLAELFARAGYRTASFVSNGFVGSESGLARGFEQASTWLSGTLAVNHALAWLEEQQKRPEQAPPFFLFVHLVEPHMPYAPPPEDVAPFLDPAYPGPLGTYVDGSSLPERPTDADRRRIVDLYDGDVHWADRLAGRVFDAVGGLGASRRTLVAVVADHGEEL
jgi:arylsulfatase A-like enzyme